jgi:branched-chain amino acid transport system ATP-binding protein
MSTLSLQGVSKVYGNQVGLAPLSVNIEPGITGLIGSNGAGKSTLFNLLAQLDSPTHGRIIFDGINTHQNPRTNQSGRFTHPCSIV